MLQEEFDHLAEVLRSDAGYGDLLCEWCADHGKPAPEVLFPSERHLVDAALIAEFEASTAFIGAVHRSGESEQQRWEWWGR